MNFLLVECDKGSEFAGPTKTKLVISGCKYYLMLSWAVFFIHITQSEYIVYFVCTLMMFCPNEEWLRDQVYTVLFWIFRLEQSRLNLWGREKELAKSGEFKDNELQRAKTFYEEANDQLLKAIKSKNLNEATVAQGLLEVAKTKMEDVIEQSRQCSSKRSQLDKNKKRLLEGYSKHLYSKRKKCHWMLRTRSLLIYCNH